MNGVQMNEVDFGNKGDSAERQKWNLGIYYMLTLYAKWKRTAE